MKILHITPKMHIGGAEIVVKDLVLEAQKAGHNASVLTFSNAENHIVDELRANNINLLKLPHKSPYSPKSLMFFLKLLKNEKFDIIHTHMPLRHKYLTLINYFQSLPLITTEHVDKYKDVNKNRFFRWVYMQYKDVVLCSHDMRDYMLKYMPNLHLKSRVIHNGITQQNYKIVKQTDSKPLKALTISRLDKQKDLTTCIKAFSKIKANIELSIVGDGPQRKMLTNLIKELNLTNKIKLLGWQSSTAKHLAQADIYIQSSVMEGFSIGVLEAMASGLPMIVSNAGGIVEAVGDAALIFPMGDVDLLAKHLDNVANNLDLRSELSKKSLERVKPYTLEATWHQYYAAYCNIAFNK